MLRAMISVQANYSGSYPDRYKRLHEHAAKVAMVFQYIFLGGNKRFIKKQSIYLN